MFWETRYEIESISKPIEEILRNRDIDNVREYLEPTMEDLYLPKYDPYGLKDMSLAVARTTYAIDNSELICIIGDYDADGVTSTSLSVRGLEDLGAKVHWLIPNRKDGYGISNDLIDEALVLGAKLIITVDNGIVAYDQMEYAKQQGIDIIITDHHEPQGEVMPDAFAVINPKQPFCNYPTKDLCGCGVMFKFLQALHKSMSGDMKRVEKYLDIVAIGTIADVMKLIGENRLFVRFGLEMMNDSTNKGLQALLHRTEKQDTILTVKDIGFSIAPILNAVGRLYHAGEAVELLTTKKKREAFDYAKRLDEINKERQTLTEKWTRQIMKQVKSNELIMSQKVMMILIEDEVPEGLVGLIAGKLKSEFDRPVILLTADHHDGKLLKGSGRSIPEYDMFTHIDQVKHLLEKFGGHTAACGLSLKRGNLGELATALNDKAVFEDGPKKLYIDYEIEPECIDTRFVDEVRLMAPFGNGNQNPLFMLRDVWLINPKSIGKKGTTFKATAECNDESFEAIGFNMYPKWQELGEPQRVDIAFTVDFNEWNGKRTIQLVLTDIRIHEED